MQNWICGTWTAAKGSSYLDLGVIILSLLGRQIKSRKTRAPMKISGFLCVEILSLCSPLGGLSPSSVIHGRNQGRPSRSSTASGWLPEHQHVQTLPFLFSRRSTKSILQSQNATPANWWARFRGTSTTLVLMYRLLGEPPSTPREATMPASVRIGGAGSWSSHRVGSMWATSTTWRCEWSSRPLNGAHGLHTR